MQETITDLNSFINDDDWGDSDDEIKPGEDNTPVPKTEAHTPANTQPAQKNAPAQKKRKKNTCLLCNQEKTIASRGMCSSCYQKHRRSIKDTRNTKRETNTKKESDSTIKTQFSTRNTTPRTRLASNASKLPNTWASTSATLSNISGAQISNTGTQNKTSKRQFGTSSEKSKEGASMKNKLTDLNNHLFMQLERLNDETLDPEALETEVNRSKAITGVSNQIISVGKLALDAQKAVSEGNVRNAPQMLGVEENEMGK